MALAPGYDPQEALDMLGICAYAETDAAQPPIPDPTAGWTLLVDSPVMGWFDNKWQLWQKKENGPFAIAIRGTVAKAGSIMEDLVSLMIEARGALKVGNNYIKDYQFSDDPNAGVHLGFALGLFALLDDPVNGILAQIKTRITPGSDVYVTGHSQGAAIATLLRSYLHYKRGLPDGCSVKTYVYAQPRPGNTHYAEDFEEKFCAAGMAFRVTNTLDWVPEVPFTLQLIDDIDVPNPLSMLGLSIFVHLIKSGLDEIYSLIARHTQSHFQPAAASLLQSGTSTEPRGVFAPLAVEFTATFSPSLNYVNAGADQPLTGVPAQGQDAQDFLFEHHATTYYRLMTTAAP